MTVTVWLHSNPIRRKSKFSYIENETIFSLFAILEFGCKGMNIIFK